jgi:hypothetical protein
VGNFSEYLGVWPVLVGTVAFIVWLVRLEGRVTYEARITSANEKRIDTLEEKHHALDSKVVEQLSDVRESLARIEGALGVKPNAKL